MLSNRRINMALLLACTLVSMESNAWAYIDPGSGALIWQSLLASAFGAAFYFRTFIKRAFLWFRRGGSTQSEHDRG